MQRKITAALVLGNGAYLPGEMHPGWEKQLWTYFDLVARALVDRRIIRIYNCGGVRHGKPAEAYTTLELLHERYFGYAAQVQDESDHQRLDHGTITLVDTNVNTWQGLFHGLHMIEADSRGHRSCGRKLCVVVFGNWPKQLQIKLWLRCFLMARVFGHDWRKDVAFEVVGIDFYGHKAWVEGCINTFEGLLGLMPRYRHMMERAGENYSSPVYKVFSWVMLHIFHKNV